MNFLHIIEFFLWAFLKELLHCFTVNCFYVIIFNTLFLFSVIKSFVFISVAVNIRSRCIFEILYINTSLRRVIFGLVNLSFSLRHRHFKRAIITLSNQGLIHNWRHSNYWILIKIFLSFSDAREILILKIKININFFFTFILLNFFGKFTLFHNRWILGFSFRFLFQPDGFLELFFENLVVNSGFIELSGIKKHWIKTKSWSGRCESHYCNIFIKFFFF